MTVTQRMNKMNCLPVLIGSSHILHLPDHNGVFNTSNDPDVTAAFTAGFYVNVENPLQPSPHGAYFWCAQVIEARFSAAV